jgi:hypothetical protein
VCVCARACARSLSLSPYLLHIAGGVCAGQRGSVVCVCVCVCVCVFVCVGDRERARESERE